MRGDTHVSWAGFMEIGTNSAAVRRIFERAWNRADFEGIEGLLGDRITLHYRRSSRIADLGDLQGMVAA